MYGTYRQLNTARRSSSPEMQFYTRPNSPENRHQQVGKLNGLRYRLENCNWTTNTTTITKIKNRNNTLIW